MIKAKLWKGNDLKGNWSITYKIDGVRGLVVGGKIVSRSGKPLHNLEEAVAEIGLTDFEVFNKDWSTTVSMVRTHNSDPVHHKHIFSLSPIDPRLLGGVLIEPSADQIKHYLKRALKSGYEGLVLRQDGVWLKVKPKETFDVVVTDQIMGTGKYTNMLGAVVTDMGNVGTGFTDQQRCGYWEDMLIGKVIEVDCMGLTPNGKFRHPRFVRERFDK